MQGEGHTGLQGHFLHVQNILFLSLSIKYMVIYLIIFETLNICFIPISLGRTNLIIENETPRG